MLAAIRAILGFVPFASRLYILNHSGVSAFRRVDEAIDPGEQRHRARILSGYTSHFIAIPALFESNAGRNETPLTITRPHITRDFLADAWGGSEEPPHLPKINESR